MMLCPLPSGGGHNHHVWVDCVMRFVETGNLRGGYLMPVYGDDREWVPEEDRLVIAKVCREMESLGCEVVSIRRESGGVERWHVQWRIQDHGVSLGSYGAAGETALDATRAALSNAQSDLSEPTAL